MAKNRIAPERPKKMKDSFFKKPRPDFNSNKQQKNKKEENQQVSNAKSENFFIKSNAAGTSKEPDTSRVKIPKGITESKVDKKSLSQELKADKKPFDKKKYRLQKYSKKYKLQQWEDKRKKSVLRSYYKSVNEEDSNRFSKIYEENRDEIDGNATNQDVDKTENSSADGSAKLEVEDSLEKKMPPQNSSYKRNKPFRKAQQEFQRIKEEKEKKKELLSKQKAEKEEALQAYKKKKIEKHRKLSRRNKKGQPIMKGRIEMLLEKIQNSIKQ